jgi:hypothetical protein
MRPTLALRQGQHDGLTYESGEEIHPGDRVTYGDNPGTIELVVDGGKRIGCGAGVMVVEPKVFGESGTTVRQGLRS